MGANPQWGAVLDKIFRGPAPELVMGWVHPWVGLGQSFFLIFGGLGWVGWRLDCVIFLTS